MAHVDFKRGRVRFKVVLYGPDQSGKTANLQHLGSLSSGGSDMVQLGAEDDEVGLFEYLPLNLGKLRGIDTVIKLYTVPGRVSFDRTRQMILKDVDGIVFVADSQEEMLEANLGSMEDMRTNLASLQIREADLPIVIQYNKRDLDNTLPVEMLEEMLNPDGWPMFEASASTGQGIKRTVTIVSQMVYQEAAAEYCLVPSLMPGPPPAEALDSDSTVESKDGNDDGVQPVLAAEPADEEAEQLPGGDKDEELPKPVRAANVPAAPGADEKLEDDEGEFQLQYDEVELWEPTDSDAPGPPNELSSGVAQHIIKSVPPPPAMTRSSIPTPLRGPGGQPQVSPFDLLSMIGALEGRLLARLGDLEFTMRELTDVVEKSLGKK